MKPQMTRIRQIRADPLDPRHLRLVLYRTRF
jgi:hypothetical protein